MFPTADANVANAHCILQILGRNKWQQHLTMIYIFIYFLSLKHTHTHSSEITESGFFCAGGRHYLVDLHVQSSLHLVLLFPFSNFPRVLNHLLTSPLFVLLLRIPSQTRLLVLIQKGPIMLVSSFVFLC